MELVRNRLFNLNGNRAQSSGGSGTPGADGTDGATWRSGTGAPSNGLGANGDFYLNTANGDVYKKASGTYSVDTNIKGASGNNGTDGNTVLNGIEPPDGSAGNEGDFFIDTLARAIYGPKTSGDWGAPAYFHGPYKKYVALVTTQDNGTDPPIVEVLENSIGAISWAYVAEGQIKAVSSGLFTVNKTGYFVGPPSNDLTETLVQMSSNDDASTLFIYCIEPGTGGKDMLFKTMIEIRVYP